MKETLLMTANNLAPRDTAIVQSVGDDPFKLGKVLYESGYFADVKNASQAVVKILRGRELGLGPIESMENINVINGKTGLSAGLIAARIKGSEKYDYRIIALTDEGCELLFLERGKELGRSSFGKADATKAELTSRNYSKFPRNMYFARALTNGARWYTPDVFGGPIYTGEELGDITEDVPAVPESIEMPTEEPQTARPEIKRSDSAKAQIREWWGVLQSQGANVDIVVPDIDWSMTNREMIAEHETWLAVIGDKVTKAVEDAEAEKVRV